MFAKLIMGLFCATFFCVKAETSGPIFFENIDSAKKWFSTIYAKYDVLQDKKYPEIYAFYGIKGSGITKVDGWFFSCQENGKFCSLICMADFGESRNFKPAEIGFEKSTLVFKTNAVQIKFNTSK